MVVDGQTVLTLPYQISDFAIFCPSLAKRHWSYFCNLSHKNILFPFFFFLGTSCGEFVKS